MSTDWRATCVDLCRFSATSHYKYLPLQKKDTSREKWLFRTFLFPTASSGGRIRSKCSFPWSHCRDYHYISRLVNNALWPAVTHEDAVSFAEGGPPRPDPSNNTTRLVGCRLFSCPFVIKLVGSGLMDSIQKYCECCTSARSLFVL